MSKRVGIVMNDDAKQRLNSEKQSEGTLYLSNVWYREVMVLHSSSAYSAGDVILCLVTFGQGSPWLSSVLAYLGGAWLCVGKVKPSIVRVRFSSAEFSTGKVFRCTVKYRLSHVDQRYARVKFGKVKHSCVLVRRSNEAYGPGKVKLSAFPYWLSHVYLGPGKVSWSSVMVKAKCRRESCRIGYAMCPNV